MAEEGIKLIGFKQARRHVSGLIDEHGLHDLVRRNYRPEKESKGEKKAYSREDLTEGRTRLDDLKYIPNTVEAATVEAFTDSAAVYYAMRDEMEGYLLSRPSRRGRNRLTDTEERFVNLFSLYGGCVEALSHLERHISPDDVHEFFSVQKQYREIWGNPSKAMFQLEDPREKVLNGFLDEYINRFIYTMGVVVSGGLIHKEIKKRDTTPEGNFSGLTYNFFMALLGYLIDEKEKEEYEELVEEVQFPLGLHRETITGFSYDPSGFREVKLTLDVDFKDIIGNQEAIDFLKHTLQRKFLYDPATRKNLYEEKIGVLPKTGLLYAGPGTGKTMLIKAAIKYGYELSEKTGIPFTPVIISQDFKTEFYGQSSRRLTNLFRKGTNPRGVGLIITEDLDGLVKNRSDADLSSGQAEENVLHTMLNLYEGVESEDNGNWLGISSSNRSHDVDKALAGRAGITKIHCPGATTLAELKQLNLNLTELGRTNKYLEVSEKEWDEIAQACKDNSYNGRQIRNAAHKLLGGVGNYLLPDEILIEKDVDKRHKELLKGMRKRKVTGKDLLKAIEQAAEDELREADYDINERANDRAERFFIDKLGQDRGMKRYAEYVARMGNEDLDDLGPEEKKLLERMNIGENKRLDEENRTLRRGKHDLETENIRLQRELDKATGKKGKK